ncbi:MAG: ATP-binding protein [Candidatus Sedimenticola sp. (ex Thyasira tokunagai)]
MIFRRLSRIKTRALLLSLVPAAIMALTLTVYIIDSQLNNLAKLFEERGNAVAQEAAAYCVYGIFSGDQKILESSLQEISKRKDVTSIQVIDTSGSTLVTLRGRSEESTNPINKNTNRRYFSAPVVSYVKSLSISDYPDQLYDSKGVNESTAIGTAIIEIDNTQYTTRQTEIIRNSLLICIIGLLFTALVTSFLSRKITRPLSRLTQAVIRMKHGDFSKLVPEESKGEFRSLEEGFNAMAKELQHSHAIMQSQIDQATSDLVETMEAIEVQNVELDLARKRALKISYEKSSFLANMSHEIRTPMNGVIGFSRLLKKSDLSHEQQDLVETIEKSASSLLKIINGILDYSKLEHGDLEPDHAPFSTTDCFEEPVTLLAPAAHDKMLEMVLLVYSDVPSMLVGDEARIRQVLVNLIGNAIKFTHEGEIVIRVMVENETDEECTLQFSVTDTGIGIPEHAQSGLFHSFQQGSRSTSKMYGGTGLGLSISKKLVKTMHGTITFESNEGQGSSFNVKLRLQKPDEPEARQARPLAGKRGLILDDNHLARLSLKHKLTSLGMVSSESVHEHFQPQQIDDVDLVLLGFSAEQLATGDAESSIHKVRNAKPKRLLALLSTSDREVLRECRKSWGIQCFSKPQTNKNLHKIINAVLSDSTPVELLESNPNLLPSFSNYRFLVADDNPINLQLISTILKSNGAEVVEKSNGLETVEYIKTHPCDLIFMDIHMPVMDGKEATHEIRKWEDGKRHVPIIALTADVVSKSKEQLLDIGVDHYLTKPIDDIELWSVICQLLHVDSVFQSLPVETKSQPEEISDGDKQLKILPSRDIDAAMKIVGGRKELADEMFDCFLEELPHMLAEINRHNQAEDWHNLRETAHRLCGSCAVCGVPRIHTMIADLENLAENRQAEQANALIVKIMNEAKFLMEQKPQ